MLTHLFLAHACGTQVHLASGAWTSPLGTALTHCYGCGEWLGSAFARAEDSFRPAPCSTRRRCGQ
jgi:hypothetical protein